MTKTIDENLASALVKVASRALKSPGVGSGLAAALRSSSSSKPSTPTSSNTRAPAAPKTATRSSSGDKDFDGFNYNKYSTHVGSFESGGRKYGNANYGQRTNFGYVGKYGIGSQALEQAGLLKPGASKRYGTWGKNAAIYQPDAWVQGKSYEQFLKSADDQEHVNRELTRWNYNYLKKKGVIRPDMSHDEIAGRLYAAAHGGAGGAEKYFVHGKDTRDRAFKNASVGKSYAAMKQHYTQYGNEGLAEDVPAEDNTIDEGVGALVRLASRAIRSPSVRQTARTGALGAGLATVWRNTYGGDNTPRQPSSRGGNTPRQPSSSADTTWNRMVGTESGGRQFSRSGQTLTSRAGAIGAAQIMPQYGAEFARRAGVEWDERRARTDRDYNLRLGRAQFDHLLKTYNGDHSRAAAAYNAGARRLRDAERSAARAGNPDAWRDYLPAETRDYLRKNIREDSSVKYMTVNDIIAKTVDTYCVNERPVQLSLDEAFVACLENFNESHAILLLNLFNDLTEENQETMFEMVQTDEGVRELLDFAIDKYMAIKN